MQDDGVAQEMENTLTAAGYGVRRVYTSYAALAALEGATPPFAVMISGYRMPRMGGDELLRNAKGISSDTQRMLLIDSHETDTVISAVNRAGIHSCIVLPYQPELFLAEIAQRVAHFDRLQKKKRLLKVTRHQNRQLYTMAKQLKDRKKAFELRIQNKQKALNTLKKAASVSIKTGAIALMLERLLKLKGITLTKVGLQKAFKPLSRQLKSYLDLLIEVEETDLDDPPKQDIEPAPFPENFLTRLMAGFFHYERGRLAIQALDEREKNGDETMFDGRDERLIITFSKENLTATLSMGNEKENGPPITLEMIHERLKKEGITHGIVGKDEILNWLEGDPGTKPPLVIAKGSPPLLPVDATVTFHFDVNYRQVGKIDEKGNIDFKEQGGTPFVKSGDLLAEKRQAVSGKPGMDVFGEKIPVDPPREAHLDAGSNARLSDDRRTLIATSDGRPHLDAMGTVSVYPEMQIKGDVDFKTGNIHFNGNLVVSGCIREGFSVRCANLTADQVHGAEVNITGDLNVSTGIIDSHVINVQGNIQAKYVNNSRIKGFRDLIVQREIIDSKVFVGGECINSSGSIIASFINAKGGIRSGTVGREKAAPVTLEVGTEGLLEMIIAELDERIDRANHEIEIMRRDIERLEAEETLLHETISHAAYVQDRSQIELRDLQQKMPDLEQSGDIERVNDALEVVTELQMRADEAEIIINDAFERQDEIMEQMSSLQRKIREQESMEITILEKKERIRAHSRSMPAIAEVLVNQSIVAGTKVIGKKSRVVLKEDLGACRIHEVRSAGRTASMPYSMRFSSIQ